MRRSKAREGDQGEGDVVGAPMRYEMADQVAATARMRASRAPGDAENLNFAQEHKFILAQERTFLRTVVAYLLHRYLVRRRHHGRERCRWQLLTSAPIFASCTKAAAL
jgi:hypothetical protein